MADNQLKRRLSALINADVVGYSRLMAEDEVATVRALTACRQKIGEIIDEHGGRLVDFVGDNLLAEFSNTSAAVECARQIHRALERINSGLSAKRRLLFRIGIHMGDVMSDGERLYGDGVNIAARIQALAEPGGTCLSDMVYRQVQGSGGLHFIDLGEKALKNIPEPVRIFRLREPEKPAAASPVDRAAFPPPTLPLPAKPSLAVLPFVNLNKEYLQDDFIHGLALDLIASLVQIPGLLLISDVTTFNQQSNILSARELGSRLGVGHVLDGGVRRSGLRLRITARLTETAAGRQIWAKRFDGDLDDLFTVQDEIVSEIVTAMDVELVSGGQALIVRQALNNPSAIESYYRGWGAMFSSSPNSIRLAQSMFEETIRREPESSIGYAMAAWAYWFELSQSEGEYDPRLLRRAKQRAEKALQMQDVTGMPNLVMAHLQLLERKHDRALESAEKALLSRPSCDASYAIKANIMNYLGRPEEAVSLSRHAMRLSPVFPSFYPAVLAAAYYGSGKFAEAVAAAKISLQADPENKDALIILAAASAAVGDMASARSAVRSILELQPDFDLSSYAAHQPYKNPKDLQQRLDHLRQTGL